MNLFKNPDAGKAKDYNLVFFDQRKRTTIGKTIIGHNGFAVLNIDNDTLSIEYKDETTWLFREDWKIDLQTGKLAGKATSNPAVNLQLVSGLSFDDAVR